MKKFSISGSLGALAALLAATTLHAQPPAQGQGQAPVPMVEIFGCNYRDGNDIDDLLAVTARWNQWADRHEVTDYTAILLTPVLYSDELGFDVLWLGADPSGSAFGAGLGLWLSEGGEMQAAFDEVTDCATHSLYAAVIQRQPQGPPPESGLVAFSDCTLNPGRNIAETVGAAGRWADFLGNNGLDVFAAQLYPGGGQRPSASYTYKAITGFDSAEGYGRFLDVMTRNGFQGANAQSGIMGPYVTCDSARLYASSWVRMAEQ